MTENALSETTYNTKTNNKISNEKVIPVTALNDPLLIQSIGLKTDLYAITWTALRNDVWQDINFREQKIFLLPEDLFWLKTNFFIFITILILTIIILITEMFSRYLFKPASLTIMILRITLVSYSQKKLGPEFSQSIGMLRYAINNSESFSSPYFAYFISICQFIITSITFTCMILTVCMADHALKLVMGFAGLKILSELDNWLGRIIVGKWINNDEHYCKTEELNLSNINCRMSLKNKLAFMLDYLEIIVNRNWQFTTSNFIRCF